MEAQTVTTKSFVPLYHHFTKNRLTYCRQNEAKKQINNNKRKRNPALAASLYTIQFSSTDDRNIVSGKKSKKKI